MYNEIDRDVTYEIIEAIGVVATYPTGWRKELNIVSWNGGASKYDIRDWSPDHEHMSRGITLHEKEMRMIIDLFRKRRQPKRNTEQLQVAEDIVTPESADDFDDPVEVTLQELTEQEVLEQEPPEVDMTAQE